MNSNQANEMMPESANMQDKVAAALLTDIKTVNKIEEKKLLKYNNLYDKLRKKQDELQILQTQRDFIIQFQVVRFNAKEALGTQSDSFMLMAKDPKDQIKNIKDEIENISQSITDLNTALQEMINTCQAFQDYSLYHQILKVSLTDDIAKVEFDMEEELTSLQPLEEAVEKNSIEEDLTQTT